jgi:26S proteasome regulatory subunit N12
MKIVCWDEAMRLTEMYALVTCRAVKRQCASIAGLVQLQHSNSISTFHLPAPTSTALTMAERELQDILRKLKSSRDYSVSSSLLSKAKIVLLKLKALTPQPTTPPSVLLLAREVFEHGALLSIRAEDPAAFTRYVHQLTPFYELPAERLSPAHSEKNKITGLYLLLLLTQGDYSGFHTELEGLELRGGQVEEDRYLRYPIKLERWLMEGSYDLVWKAMASGEVPSEEYGVFSKVSCLPISVPYPAIQLP